jgi:hypothetical protein
MPNGETAFGDSCTGAGDVDGDGYGDVIVGTATDGVYLFLGSPSGIQTTISASAFGGTGTGASVTSIAPAGDVNGDGFADIIVGAYGANLVKVLHGGMGGTLTSGTTFASLPAGGGYGWSVATVGDVDSDGFAEIAFTPSNCMGHDVYVYRGSALGVDMSTPLNQWAKPSGTTCFGVLAR